MIVYIVKNYDGNIDILFDNEQDAIDYCREWNKNEDGLYLKRYCGYEVVSGKYIKTKDNFYFKMVKME